MNIEPDIFDYLETTSLEPHDDYTSEITYKDQKIIWKRLKEKDKEIKRLNNELKLYKDNHEHLNNLLQQKENIIKEVRKIFKDYGDKEDIVGYTMYNITGEMLITLLEILDKEKNDR